MSFVRVTMSIFLRWWQCGEKFSVLLWCASVFQFYFEILWVYWGVWLDKKGNVTTWFSEKYEKDEKWQNDFGMEFKWEIKDVILLLVMIREFRGNIRLSPKR